MRDVDDGAEDIDIYGTVLRLRADRGVMVRQPYSFGRHLGHVLSVSQWLQVQKPVQYAFVYACVSVYLAQVDKANYESDYTYYSYEEN